jgi:4-hydroxy-3-methylbut-2-enyl diphosphate reductase
MLSPSSRSSSGQPRLRVVVAKPRGFCAGVTRAIEIVEQALQVYGAPVYVRHEIVHNRHVVEALSAKGAVFVGDTGEIPEGAVTIFSAHGVSSAVESAAAARALNVLDATCPLVSKVHNEGRRAVREGREVVLIGHRGHPEVEGTMGQIPGPVVLVTDVAEAESFEPRDPERLSFVTQTTLSVDDTADIIAALRRRFPKITGPNLEDICYATQNRQTVLRTVAARVDVILVVGAPNSSNSNRLREIGETMGVPSYLIEDADALQPAWLEGAQAVGVTAGASAPEDLVTGLLSRLGALFDIHIEHEDGAVEDIQFRLPRQLTEDHPAGVPA